MREVLPLSLVLVDVDHFKLYNDYYGHQRGDECLAGVAAELDRFPKRPGDSVSRDGGEEFIVLLLTRACRAPRRSPKDCVSGSRRWILRHGESARSSGERPLESWKGCVFTIEITPLQSRSPPQPVPPPQAKEDGTAKSVLPHRRGVLIVEDDPGVREHLALLITEQGHRVTATPDGGGDAGACRKRRYHSRRSLPCTICPTGH